MRWFMIILALCVKCLTGFKRTARFVLLRRGSRSIQQASTETADNDAYNSFSAFDKLLFGRFAVSVAAETGRKEVPRDYRGLMDAINDMTILNPSTTVHDQGKSILTRLFPGWLLKQYQWMFAAPFPAFSAWMNSWVTHWTTNWLMGNSTIYDLEFSDGTIGKEQGLLVEKCRFFEEAGCVRTCIHACKIPTQRFFLEEMGLPVTLRPNITDYSCRFEFGVKPLPIELDEVSKFPCLESCSTGGSKKLLRNNNYNNKVKDEPPLSCLDAQLSPS